MIGSDVQLKIAEAQRRAAEAKEMELREQRLINLNAALLNPDVADRLSLVRQREELIEQGRSPKRQRKAEACSGFDSPVYAVTPVDLENSTLWRTALEVDDIPRTVVSQDQLLSVKEVAFKADIRWLQLHISSRGTGLDDLKQMKAARSNTTKHDLENVYHPLILHIYRAAALGQAGIDFVQELHQGVAREDIRCIILENRMEPTEAKSHFTGAAGDGESDQQQALDAHREAFGKLLKCTMENCPNPGGTRLCTFVSRIECLWLVEFHFSAEGFVDSCRVAPGFPSPGTS